MRESQFMGLARMMWGSGCLWGGLRMGDSRKQAVTWHRCGQVAGDGVERRGGGRIPEGRASSLCSLRSRRTKT